VRFGTLGWQWGLFSFAGSGQPAPTATVTPDSHGLAITASLDPALPASSAYAGVGLYFSSASCLDVTAYTGVQFDLTGTVAGCALTFGANDSEDLSTSDDAIRGGCTNAICYGPSQLVAPTSTGTIQVPFAAMTGGTPDSALDATTLVSIQWEVLGAATALDGSGCSAAFTVENVQFY
jgi:hypothetical protein